MNIKQSVSTLEEGTSNIKEHGQYGYESLPQVLVQKIREMSNSPEVVEVYRRIQYSQLSHIINLTKQKLIDTLLELDKAFPDLENEYEPSNDEKKEASTIITTNIYGSNVNSNIGVGDEIHQTQKLVTPNPKLEKILEEIKNLGVEEGYVLEVEKIINEEKDKTSISKKLLAWTGKVATKSLEKGIEINIPLLIEKVQALF